MIHKCKMCDGVLKVVEGKSIATCEYCGVRQTIPCPNSAKIAELYSRADEYRRGLEFDKALALYEEILLENPADAEAYWLTFLCEYGIDYVEDITEGKRVPTINRMQFTSVYDNENYKAALHHADAEQQMVYREEAEAISNIQKDILKICEKEEPFDIFICYKEGDGKGRRTIDSVLATDIYELLVKEGYKVFFSRVTLDDKFGVAYEPYIFAALQSAKVMIVVGSKPEYMNSVWVRNEWSRYLALMKRDNKKVLIPAYKDMNPYKLPEEFAHLQAINLGELGYQQDLLAGIRKIISDEDKRKSILKPEANVNIKAVLGRGFLFIEDGNWERAEECMETVLQKQSWNAQAYLGKLLIDLKIPNKEELSNCKELLEYHEYYGKILELKDEELKMFLREAMEESKPGALEKIYIDTIYKAENSENHVEIRNCIPVLEKLGDYKDTPDKIEEYRKKAEALRLEQLEEKYVYHQEALKSKDREKCQLAYDFYNENKGYKNSAAFADRYREKLRKFEEEARKKKEREQRTNNIKELGENIGSFSSDVMDLLDIGKVIFGFAVLLIGMIIALLKSCFH